MIGAIAILLSSFLFGISSAVLPNVPWAASAKFNAIPELSDEFDGSNLNLNKWDENGMSNPNTLCPSWNGPVYWPDTRYSTFFPATTNPKKSKPPIRFYSVSKGRLVLKTANKSFSFFKARQYYCNSTTFRCNHDPNRPCNNIDFFGRDRYDGIVHDRCKIAPFCIPHPEHVKHTGIEEYAGVVAPHITSRAHFHYGFLEARIRLSDTPANLAVWMHENSMTDGYCRFRRAEGPDWVWRECPSIIRSRRWQEIDVVEAMNSQNHKYLYMPNVHVFAMSKGEFTTADNSKAPEGMGGGPIVVREDFALSKPSFADVPEGQQVPNDWHWNPGPVAKLDRPWALKTRTVGLYWSPKELRFYLDGKEVARMANPLVHQPMRLDLAYGLNPGWAGQLPTKRELRRSAKIFYVRAWKVFTADGKDPPSSLPLRTDMKDTFSDLYGNKLYGVFNRFPVSDNLTRIPPTPSPRHAESMSGPGGYLPAGGVGNTFPQERSGKLESWALSASLSRPDRVELLGQGAIVNPGITLYEFADPNKVQAGWASINGSGNGDEMAW